MDATSAVVGAAVALTQGPAVISVSAQGPSEEATGATEPDATAQTAVTTQAELLAAASTTLGPEVSKQLSQYLNEQQVIVNPQEEFNPEVEEILRHEMGASTHRNYNKRNRRLYAFIKESYPKTTSLFPESYQGVGRDPTKHSPDDPNWLNYAKLSAIEVCGFMAQLRNPKTQMKSSHTDVRKYADAIKYDAPHPPPPVPPSSCTLEH